MATNAETITSLRALADRLRALPTVMDKVAKDIAKVAEAQIAQEFSSATDPLGRSWHTKSGNPTTLQATGALRSSLRVTASAGEVKIRGSKIARLYQYAWKAATFLPNKLDLTNWSKPIREAARLAIETHLAR